VQHTDPSDKKKLGDLNLKLGQLEASAMAEERALEVWKDINVGDPELYQPVKE